MSRCLRCRHFVKYECDDPLCEWTRLVGRHSHYKCIWGLKPDSCNMFSPKERKNFNINNINK